MKKFFWNAIVNDHNRTVDIPYYSGSNNIEKWSKEANGEPFLVYLQYSVVKGSIFKKQYKTIYPTGCYDLTSFKNYLKKVFNEYNFQFVDSYNFEYIVLKFSNVIKNNKNAITSAENNYLDFFTNNHEIVSRIIDEIGIRSYWISNDLKRALKDVGAIRQNVKIKIGMKSINCDRLKCGLYDKTIYFSSLGMDQLPNSDTVCKLGVSIAKIFERTEISIPANDYYFKNTVPIRLKLECNYDMSVGLGEFNLFLKPIIIKNGNLNSWN